MEGFPPAVPAQTTQNDNTRSSFFRRHQHSPATDDASKFAYHRTRLHIVVYIAMTPLPALLLLARLSAGHVVLAHANDDLTPIVVVGTCYDANLGLIGSLE